MVEPPEDKGEAHGPEVGKTLDLARIKSLLQISKQKYLEGASSRGFPLAAFCAVSEQEIE